MQVNLKKDFIWNMIGSTFSSFNSLFFLIIVTRINGSNEAGIFTFAFSTACLFYIIGIYSGRVFQVTDNNKNISGSDYLYSKIITCFLMFLFSFLFCMMRGYNLYKIEIILGLVLFKVLEAFSEGIYAIIQQEKKLYQVGISLFLKAFISVLFFLICDSITKNLLLSIFLVILVNFLVLLFYDFHNLKKVSFKMENFEWKKILFILKSGFYAFAFAFLTQYVINAPKYAIDSLLNNEAQTIFGIIIMPATILILLGQFVIHPFLVSLKEKLQQDKKEFLKLTCHLVLVILILGIFSTLAAYFLGIPVLKLLYNIDLKSYLNSLLLIIIGATCYEISVIFSTSLTTMRSTLSQLIIFVIASVFIFFLSNYLVRKEAVFGASISYLFTMILIMILYIIVFLILLNKYQKRKDRVK